MSDRALLEIAGLTYTYPGARGRPALRDVSLRVGEGEFVVLAGRSASGKSSLLRACCGLVPHFHGGELAGRVMIAGLDALALGPAALAEHVGYVAQEPETQILSTTVAAEISLPLELRGRPEAERARAVEEVALALAIPDLLERTVQSLSGGELQRVALAAALVTRPRLVLLDEPTSQLDPVAGDELIWLLRRLNSEWGVTFLLAEHRLERCLDAADRVLAFADGRLAYNGDPAGFLGWAAGGEPALATPGARLFAELGIEPPPTGVRAARRTLEERGLAATVAELRRAREEASGPDDPGGSGERGRRGERGERRTASRVAVPGARGGKPALRIRNLWIERGEGEERRDVLRGVDLEVAPGEKLALMGRNGAGKSTLLRAAAGLLEPVRGAVETPGGIALLTQNPADYLVRERVGDELPGEAGAAALDRVGLSGLEDADPRDLSGGQRQRLALAITMAGRTRPGEAPALVALDEPTRGLDPGLKAELAEFAAELAAAGSAVVIATHDVEFAAGFADRVVLLGPGRVLADGAAGEVLAGGWYFATETARILDLPGVVTPAQAVAALKAKAEAMEVEP